MTTGKWWRCCQIAWGPAHHNWLTNQARITTLMAFYRLRQPQMFNLRVLKRLTNIIDLTSRNTSFVQDVNPLGSCFCASNCSDFSVQRVTVFRPVRAGRIIRVFTPVLAPERGGKPLPDQFTSNGNIHITITGYKYASWN